jgi:hypothetical protein
MVDWLLKDKALIYWEDMALTTTWDFQVVVWNENILQAAQNRVVAYIDTRKFDDNFGSEIQAALHNTPAYKVTDAMMTTHVTYALQTMLLDWRVQNINSVKIISRERDSILIEIILTLGTYKGSIVIEVPNFIS